MSIVKKLLLALCAAVSLTQVRSAQAFWEHRPYDYGDCFYTCGGITIDEESVIAAQESAPAEYRAWKRAERAAARERAEDLADAREEARERAIEESDPTR